MIRPSPWGAAALPAAMLVVFCAGCAGPQWKRLPHDRFFQSAAPPAEHGWVAERAPSEWWDAAWHSTFRPLGESISPGYHLRRALGGLAARDINAFGQVPDSSWYVNRVNRHSMSADEVRRGPNAVDAPSDGPLNIIAVKAQGVTPGFIVQDGLENLWVIKFDPPAFPEMASGAEVVSTKLFHALGYHVPENLLVTLELARLQLVPGATSRDTYNREQPLTQADVDRLLAQLNPHADGTVRALFSRVIPGEPLGPFQFEGMRHDDPNDTIAHELRRSLRGLWLFAAWLNHVDIPQSNSHDAFVPSSDGRGRGHVKHYLMDFGNTLGSSGTRPKVQHAGYSNTLDWRQSAVSTAALGLYYPYWLEAQKSPFRAVGIFEAEVFDPGYWAPLYPNPAFEQASAEDTYWAASVLAALTPDNIATAVACGDYSEPGAEAWVLSTLLRRREKLLRYAFSNVLALDAPQVENGTTLVLTDLELGAGLLPNAKHTYRWQARWNRTGAGDVALASGSGDQPAVRLAAALTQVLSGDHATDFASDPFLSVTVGRDSSASGPHRGEVEVHLRVHRGKLIPVGLSR